MGQTTQHTERLKDNTKLTTELVAEALPADSDITPQLLLYVLKAANEEYAVSRTHKGIEAAFAELESGENLSPYGSENPLPDELQRPTIDEIETRPTEFSESYDIDQSPRGVLFDSIAYSWEVLGLDNQMVIDYHAAVSPDINRSGPIKDVLPPEITQDNENRSRSLDPAYQQRVVVLTLLQIHKDIEKSTFSDREAIIYHLSSRYTTDEIAEILEAEFGGSVSAGNIRKSKTRIRNKLEQAEFVSDTYSIDNLHSDVDLSANEDSLLTDDQLIQATQYISGTLSSQKNRTPEMSFELKEGITLCIEVSTFDDIRVSLYCDVGKLPNPVAVEVDEIGYSDMVYSDSPISTLSSVSGEFSQTMEDIRLIIDAALRRAEYTYKHEMGQPPTLSATEAYRGNDRAGGGFVSFNGHFDVVPLGGSQPH